MSDVIRIFPPGSAERLRLAAFADEVNTEVAATGGNVTYHVEDTYFDIGTGTRWTTLIAHRTDMSAGTVLSSWQSICPPEQLAIIENQAGELAMLKRRLVEGRTR